MLYKHLENDPIWELPVSNIREYISSKTKYHCFIDNKSLCGGYSQDVEYFDTDIESGEILSRPEIACKKCYNRWKREYNIDV